MGNVHAYSAPAPPPPPPCPKPDVTKKTAPASCREKLDNPGPLEDIHTKCKSKLQWHNLNKFKHPIVQASFQHASRAQGLCSRAAWATTSRYRTPSIWARWLPVAIGLVPLMWGRNSCPPARPIRFCSATSIRRAILTPLSFTSCRAGSKPNLGRRY